ncbi:MAG: signal peptidase II [Deltaproteobacteria bacterium]|nr:signal peptidase II [Deltaproteobacteria bacterium]
MKRKYLILFSLSGLILCLDQLTKHLVKMNLEGGSISLAEPFLSLRYVPNSGFAFGLFHRVPEPLKDVFFIGVPIFALILIVLIFIKLQDNQMMTSIALTSILGGAVGNLIDRIHHGYVIDFLDVHWGNIFHLPPSNVADFAIIIGVLIMFLTTLMQDRVRQLG